MSTKMHRPTVTVSIADRDALSRSLTGHTVACVTRSEEVMRLAGTTAPPAGLAALLSGDTECVCGEW